MKNLTLVFNEYSELHNQTVFTIASGCPNLRFLRLVGLLHGIDFGLVRLYELQHLQYLDLSNTGVTDLVLQNLAEVGNLKALSLDNCVNVTDFGILNVITKCTDLKWLSVKHCKNVTDAIFNKLPKNHLTNNKIPLCIWTYDSGIDEGRKCFNSAIRVYCGKHEELRITRFK